MEDWSGTEDGSVLQGDGWVMQAGQCEFCPWNPLEGRRRQLTGEKLSSELSVQAMVCVAPP